MPSINCSINTARKIGSLKNNTKRNLFFAFVCIFFIELLACFGDYWEGVLILRRSDSKKIRKRPLIVKMMAEMPKIITTIGVMEEC